MKKIGLIGEDPNDTIAIKNLLEKEYSNKLDFRQLVRNKRGNQLDNSRFLAALKIEYAEYKPHVVIFIRDADGIITEKEKINKVKKWFTSLNLFVENKGLLLINIYELEALILADINTFNNLYGTAITYTKNVMYQSDPKGFLFKKTERNKKKYSESHCPEIFCKLDTNTLIKNCKYFDDFLKEFKIVAKLK